VRAVHWLFAPHVAASLGVCFGSRDPGEIPDERAALLEALAAPAANAVARLLRLRALERTADAREQILADIAHELRNSINAVAASNNVLGQCLEPGSPHRAILERISRNTRRAARIAEKLLDSGVIDAGKLVIRESALAPSELVRLAIQTQQDASAEAGVTIVAELAPGLPAVSGDAERLLEVFDNLIGNALKFTRAPGTVTIGAAPRDHQVLFWVKDTGIGIPLAEISHVFERYFRARPREAKGAGLGLAICKGIVEAHRGSIWAESAAEVGTTVFFTLPVH
jgi:signal transduction histidine kinase